MTEQSNDYEGHSQSVPLPQIGSYQLIRPLGSGGMSSVFLARHCSTGHEVAVKILPRSVANKPSMRERFFREARNAEALQHPNIAAIYDRGFDLDRHFLVMEYIPGGDLAHQVRENGPLSVDQACDVILGCAEALKVALAAGLVHRDVKPANLLIDAQGTVKLIDLGLSILSEEDERVTHDGTTVGTVDYMSPEQARDSRAINAQSDMYSLGCTFVFLLSGRPPFPKGTIPEKLSRHLHEPPPSIGELRPEVPDSLDQFISKLLSKKPEERFLDYDALMEALEKARLGKQFDLGGTYTVIIEDEPDDPWNDLLGTDRQENTTESDSLSDLVPESDVELSLEGLSPTTIAGLDEGESLRTLNTKGDTLSRNPIPDREERHPDSRRKIDSSASDSPATPTGSRARTDQVEDPDSDVIYAPDGREEKQAHPKAQQYPSASRPRSRSEPPRPNTLPQSTRSASSSKTLPSVVEDKPGQRDSGPPKPRSKETPQPTSRRSRAVEDDFEEVAYGGGGGFSIDLGLDSARGKGALVAAVVLAALLLFVLLPNLFRDNTPQAEVVIPLIPSRSAPLAKAAPVVPPPAPDRQELPGALAETEPEIQFDAELEDPTEIVSAPSSWVEPEDQIVSSSDFPPIPELPEGFPFPVLEWVVAASEREGEISKVRRIALEGESAVSRISEALQSGATRVVVDDAGPFHESDFRASKGGVNLTAPEGVRPIVMVMPPPPREEKTRVRKATWILESKDSVLVEGIDFIVPSSAFTEAQTALFYCEPSSSLVIRDCTFTVIEEPRDDWALVRMAGSIRLTASNPNPKPTRFHMERCLVRGVSFNGLIFEGANIEANLVESVLQTGRQPAVLLDGGTRRFRGTQNRIPNPVRLSIIHSLLATEDDLIRLQQFGRRGLLKRIMELTVTGSVLAKVGSRFEDAAILNWDDIGDESNWKRIDWDRAGNQFEGWSSIARSRQATITTPADADRVWGESGPENVILSGSAWPASLFQSAFLARGMIERAPSLEGVLNRIAEPRPYLFPVAFRGLDPLGPEEPSIRGLDRDIPRIEEGFPFSSNGDSQSRIGLSFDTDLPVMNGDLGLFLRSQLRNRTGHVHIEVIGTGRRFFSPVRVPPGLLLSIRVRPPVAEPGQEFAPLIFVPPEGLSDTPLIVARDADLAMSGVRIDAPAWAANTPLIEVDHGHLAMNQCQILGGTLDQLEIEGPLLRFASPTTEPMRQDSAIDSALPHCVIRNSLIRHAGSTIESTLGAGRIILLNAILVSGNACLDIQPATVRRDRFLVDLSLRQSTLVTPHDQLRISDWEGVEPGPHRPIRIASMRCAFLDQIQSSLLSTTLIRGESGILSHRLLSWESTSDAFMLQRFFEPLSDRPRVAARQSGNVFLDFILLNGLQYFVRDAYGPIRGQFRTTVRPARGSLVPGKIDLDALRLERLDDRVIGPSDRGADVNAIAVEPIAPEEEIAPKGNPGTGRDRRKPSIPF